MLADKVNEDNLAFKNITVAWGDAHRFSPAPRQRRRIILDILKGLTFESCLDAGCGQPYLLETLRAWGKKVYGCDISDEAVGFNRKNYPEIEFEEVDIAREAYPASKQFDVVIASELLEHIPEWADALKNLAQMSKRYLLITVPMGKIYKIDKLIGHLRHYDDKVLRGEIEKNGFKVIVCKCWGVPFHTLYKNIINTFFYKTMYKKFAENRYGICKKAISGIVYLIFFINDLFWNGSQLFILAEKRGFY